MYFTQKGTAEMKKLTSGASGQMFFLSVEGAKKTRVCTRRTQKELGHRQEKLHLYFSFFFLVLMEAELLRVGPTVFANCVSQKKRPTEKR